MPAELFRTITAARHAPGHRVGAAPITILAHVVVVVAAITIPLLATDKLPVPHMRVLFEEIPMPAVPVPQVPQAPVPRRVSLTPDAPQVPLEAPNGVSRELGLAVAPPTVADVPTSEVGTIVGVGHAALVEAEAPPPPVVKPSAPSAPVRIVTPPRKIRHVTPVYPQAALAARVEGTVVIDAIIGTDGRVQDARVIQSHLLLDDAALDAVRQWMFTPTLIGGVAAPVILTVKVEFKLSR